MPPVTVPTRKLAAVPATAAPRLFRFEVSWRSCVVLMMSRMRVASRERAPQESSVSPGRLIFRDWDVVVSVALAVGAARVSMAREVRMVRRYIVGSLAWLVGFVGGWGRVLVDFAQFFAFLFYDFRGFGWFRWIRWQRVFLWRARATWRGGAVAPLVMVFVEFSSGWDYFYVRNV